jgi:hypothetical protein
MKRCIVLFAVAAIALGATAASAQESTNIPDSAVMSGSRKNVNATVSDGKVHLDFDVPFYSVIKRSAAAASTLVTLGWDGSVRMPERI